MVMVMPALLLLLITKQRLMSRRKKTAYKTLEPCWDPGDYKVEEINESDELSISLGLSEERYLELRIAGMKAILKTESIVTAMVELSEEVVHPNELVLIGYMIGSDVTMLKNVTNFKKAMENGVKDLEERLQKIRDRKSTRLNSSHRT